ncbi:hypothetical protein E3P78_03130 [Wallemia ichthyophaga]|nr:hypothetical protein E3P78_03130 [Wallemia ichthyophaga]
MVFDQEGLPRSPSVMLKSPARSGIFSFLWSKIPKPSDRYFVGYDLEGGTIQQGNKYFEHPPTTDYKERPKRSVRYPRQVDWALVGKNMPAQWQAWLRHTRLSPPSIEELESDLLRIQRTQQNAARIDAAFAKSRGVVPAPESGTAEVDMQHEHEQHEHIKAQQHYNQNPLEAFEPAIETQEAGRTPEETMEHVEERRHGFDPNEMHQRQQEEGRLRKQAGEFAPGTGKTQEWTPNRAARRG